METIYAIRNRTAKSLYAIGIVKEKLAETLRSYPQDQIEVVEYQAVRVGIPQPVNVESLLNWKSTT